MKFIEMVFSLKLLYFIVRLRQELKSQKFRREMTKKQLEQILVDLALTVRLMDPSSGDDRFVVPANLGFTCSTHDHGREEIIAALMVLERDGCIESGQDVKVTEQGKTLFDSLQHIPCRLALEKVVATAIERIAEAITIARGGNSKEHSSKPSIKQLRLFIPKHRRKLRGKPRDMDV